MSAPWDELETLSDDELSRRTTKQLSQLQHSILNAEIQRRQMARAARTVKLAAIATGAAAASALINLFLAIARIAGWLPNP